MKPFTYPKPQPPEIVRTLNAVHRTFNAGMKLSDGKEPDDLVDGLLIATRALITEQEIARDISDEDRRELAEYNRQVTIYNERVKAYNTVARKEREDARARAATLQVRRQRCDQCFTLHGPGQVECW